MLLLALNFTLQTLLLASPAYVLVPLKLLRCNQLCVFTPCAFSHHVRFHTMCVEVACHKIELEPKL
jgi:hypothetical protein